jgi:ATP-dependent DNA helicase RecQ
MTPLEALKNYYGYDNFRPMQAEIIENICKGKDTVVIMPTGGGKSVCFQIPAIILDGICVVVSPLIALMKDQVDALQANGVAAAYINSSQLSTENARIETLALSGKLKLLYISPEKLMTTAMISFLKQLKINLFAIDEAHCISSWGHDFRPEYTQLKMLKRHFPTIPVVALTATADKITRKDIITQLALEEPELFLASFNRANLSLQVEIGKDRFKTIEQFIQQRPRQSGIIYALSRATTESLANKLMAKGIKAEAYHAGMDAAKRAKVQENFLRDETPIICATIAFGMGIDKSNVRWVIHYNLPKNMEGYYQEIGRAGRDGLPSETVLFYTMADVMMLRKFAEESGQRELQLAKLERMQQYADAQICRRKILLSYFGENLTEYCGNCDVCKNPPAYIDGTITAQKALSAIARLKEKVGMNMLIDVLRGSRNKELLEKEYDKIKTYGAGANMNPFEWQQALLQMLNLGLIEIAYDDHYALKITNFGNDVLFGNRKITFVQFKRFEPKTNETFISKSKSEAENLREELFEVLQTLRKNIADRQKVPPYVIFSDATLTEMADKKPFIAQALRNIAGVVEKKMEMYGDEFLTTIVNFATEKVKQGAKITGTSNLLSYALYKEGKSTEEIATERKLSPATISGHLIYLYENGYPIDIMRLISQEEYTKIANAIHKLQHNDVALKPIFDYFAGEIPYDKIRIVVNLEKTKATTN